MGNISDDFQEKLILNYNLFWHWNPEIILIHHRSSASIKMVKNVYTLIEQSLTLIKHVVTYSNRRVIYSNRTVIYFNRTIFYFNRTATYSESSQPRVYISKIGFTCRNLLLLLLYCGHNFKKNRSCEHNFGNNRQEK